jgi:imidazolonepropionase-like amidohydrolase
MTTLTPQARRLLKTLEQNTSITAREALLDLDMTSATLASRICDIEKAGHRISRVSKRNPTTGQRYTEYRLAQKTTDEHLLELAGCVAA